ncbi:unnamed protein product [Miscanthus lutarioriparius]|uniref:Uncharacterized protein n=1 Tax=Miscanthus lutarioriparius TaxID=422564 RepID=A0A811SN73_9POAL|nr:unnamed protein product [Miscanthus lutarioriparius]
MRAVDLVMSGTKPCRGLTLLFQASVSAYHVCNLSTGEHVSLPRCPWARRVTADGPNVLSSTGLGFDPAANEHKVVRLFEDRNKQPHCEVYGQSLPQPMRDALRAGFRMLPLGSSPGGEILLATSRHEVYAYDPESNRVHKAFSTNDFIDTLTRESELLLNIAIQEEWVTPSAAALGPVMMWAG